MLSDVDLGQSICFAYVLVRCISVLVGPTSTSLVYIQVCLSDVFVLSKLPDIFRIGFTVIKMVAKGGLSTTYSRINALKHRKNGYINDKTQTDCVLQVCRLSGYTFVI